MATAVVVMRMIYAASDVCVSGGKGSGDDKDDNVDNDKHGDAWRNSSVCRTHIFNTDTPHIQHSYVADTSLENRSKVT